MKKTADKTNTKLQIWNASKKQKKGKKKCISNNIIKLEIILYI